MRSERHVLFKCASCGALEPSPLTVFSFSGHKPAEFSCSCGRHLLTLRTHDHTDYTASFFCVICEADHAIRLNAAQVWSQPMTSLACPDTEVELAYIGRPDRVSHAVQMQKSLGELLPHDLAIAEFFTNPDVMYEVLSKLHQIAETDHLYCECGTVDIQVDLFPEKVELRCPSCRSLSIIYAENEDDLAVMGSVEVIEMKRAGFTSVDASKFGH